jgi:hypothetical protein
METNLEIEELKGKYRGFHYDILESYKGTEDFEKFRKVMDNFENEVAPGLGLFPKSKDYWITKTALSATYAGFNMYKDNETQRMRYVEDLLTTYSFNEDEIKSINNIINLRKNIEKIKIIKGLEGRVSQI